jgi:phosphoribosylglycinamide formyltransferase-1
VEFDDELADAIDALQPDWIVCAGYLRLLDASFVERFRGRLLNIHPSLLPAYRGLKTHARALADGATEHGASVHFVSPELDAGAVVAQAAVPVLPDDTPDALADRVLAAEHPLLVGVVRLAVAGRIAEAGERVLLDGHPLLRPLRVDSAGILQIP